MEKHLVSIGIPAYNKPDGLRHTLECITSQTYNNLEIIISNDGSPNINTEVIVLEYSKRDPRIKYFSHDINRGGFFNFGFVLKQATGKYFMWAADDDEWDNTYIEVCLDELRSEPNYDLVFTRYKILSNKDKKRCYLNHNLYLRSKYKKTIFLLLDECLTHKANLLYGVWRTETVKRIWDKGISCGLNKAHMGKGFDNAFLTMAMDMIDAYQIQKTLFIKRYMNRVIPGSCKSLVLAFLRNGYQFIRNPVSYCKYVMDDSKQQLELVETVYNEPKTLSVRLVYITKRILYIIFRHIL